MSIVDDAIEKILADKREALQLYEKEHTLADQLPDALLSTLSAWVVSPDAEQASKALAAWKEFRNE